jgi:cysteine desulfurase
MIYLDHNATTTIRPEVIDLMSAIMQETGNGSATHAAGQRAAAHIERAREQIANVVNTRPAQVIFTGCATESINTILKTFKGERILASAVEHAAVLDCGQADMETVSVTHDGVIDLNALEDALKREPKARLLNIVAVNNETGVINPVKDIVDLAHTHDTLVHVDAVQVIGKMPFDFKGLGADYLSLSAHKFGGSQGVGCFVFAAQKPIKPLLKGGKQEKRQRAGTSNVAGIAGMGLAADIAERHQTEYQKLAVWRDKIENEISNALDDIVINGQHANRVANTISLTCKGVTNTVQMLNLDLDKICVSAGSACSSGVAKPSHVLLGMGLDEDEALSTIRISMGWNTTQDDVDQFIEKYIAIIKRLRT